MLDLSRIDLATEEDKQYQLDHWAALFKAKTWEEIQMLAHDNNYFKEASETVYELKQEEEIRQQCLSREDYNRTMKGIENNFATLKADLPAEQAAFCKRPATLQLPTTHSGS